MHEVAVLIVEDEVEMVDFIRERLEEEAEERGLSLHLEDVNDGNTAEEFLRGNADRFDLFIMDCELPGASGMDLLKLLKDLGHGKQSIGFSQYKQVLGGMEAACALKAFWKEEPDLFFAFVCELATNARNRGVGA